MHSPTTKQFDKLIKRFDSIIDRVGPFNQVDMDQSFVHHGCGTPMCHGGWYMAAALPAEIDPLVYEVVDISYSEGAELMAVDLGFKSQGKLEDWAKDPKLWGNHSGSNMFYDPKAFCPEESLANDYFGYPKIPEDFELSLLHIRNWWVDVRNRCHPDEPRRNRRHK